ncbi:hypothetical protein ACN9MB_07020 [Dyella kyungheensis]|uniref:hypothetical protein n=1 Tax=Dyella kyungheensis TaxID=1242174 RepID=UPI003CEDBDC1
MATHDHTGRIRSSVPPDDTLTPPSGDPPSTAVAWPEPLCHGTRGDIVLAVLALTRLRIDSEQCRHSQSRGFPGRPLPWPLPVAVTASLGTAIYCLQQYARLLADEPRVNTIRLR